MSNQVYANGVQLGSPQPPVSYALEALPVTGTITINGPVSAQAMPYRALAVQSEKILILEKYHANAVSTATSWTSVELFPPVLAPSYNQSFVVPLYVNGATIRGYMTMFASGFFSLATDVVPIIGMSCGWEDITVSYL
jgi:hypothetical protein